MSQTLKKYISYLIPTVLSSLATVFYLLFDAYFIGQGVGEIALGAVNITSPYFSLTLGTGLLFGVGGATLIQIAKAKKNHELVKRFYTVVIVSSLSLSIIYFIFGNLFLEELSYLLGATDENIIYTLPYFRYIVLVSPIMVLMPILQSLVRTADKPKAAMVGLLISGFTNIVLDYTFIFIFDMGSGGAGLATAIANLCGFTYLLRYFVGKNKVYSVCKTFDVKLVKDICKIGFASFGYELGLGITIYLLNNMLSSNVLAISSYSVISYISIVVLNLFLGVTNSLHPLLSYNYGLEDHGQNKKLLKYGFVTILTIFIGAYAVINVNPVFLVNLFTDASPEMLSVATNGLKLYSNMYLFAGINMLIVVFLQCYKKELSSILASLLRSGTLIFMVLPIMNYLFEINGIWLSLTVVEFISMLIIISFYNKTRREYFLKN